jgi:hypothetical protein
MASLSEIWEHNIYFMNYGRVFIASLSKEHIQSKPVFPEAGKCYEIIDIAGKESQRTVEEWATSIAPWDNLVEKVRAIWSEQWACFHLANVASGINLKAKHATAFPIFSITLSRYADVHVMQDCRLAERVGGYNSLIN